MTWKPPLCRYCVKNRQRGRVKCNHCDGWRNPNRRAARREHRSNNKEVQGV